jgi:hypothetical protein
MEELWEARSTAGGLPRQDPTRKPPQPATGYRLICEGGQMVARGGPATRGERRAYALRCEAVRRANRNMASLVADFKLKFNVGRRGRGGGGRGSGEVGWGRGARGGAAVAGVIYIWGAVQPLANDRHRMPARARAGGVKAPHPHHHPM